MTTRDTIDYLAREMRSYEQKAADAIATPGDNRLRREYYEGVSAGLQHAIKIICEHEAMK